MNSQSTHPVPATQAPPPDIASSAVGGRFALGDARDSRGPRGPEGKPDACCKCGRPRLVLDDHPPLVTFRYASPLVLRGPGDSRPRGLDPGAPLGTDWQCADCAIKEGQARGIYGPDEG